MPPNEVSPSSMPNSLTPTKPKTYSSKLPVPPVESVRVNFADLYYQVEGSSEWTKLTNPSPSAPGNVNFIFFSGAIHIIQKKRASSTRCVLTLEKNRFQPKPFRKETYSSTSFSVISAEFVCQEPPKIGFQRKESIEDVDHDYPLAQKGHQFKAIRLVLPVMPYAWKATGGNMGSNYEIMARQLDRLVTGNSSVSLESKTWQNLINVDTLAPVQEWENQEKRGDLPENRHIVSQREPSMAPSAKPIVRAPLEYPSLESGGQTRVDFMAVSGDEREEASKAFEESIRVVQAEHEPRLAAMNMEHTAGMPARADTIQRPGGVERKRKALEDEEDEYDRQEEEIEREIETLLDRVADAKKRLREMRGKRRLIKMARRSLDD